MNFMGNGAFTLPQRIFPIKVINYSDKKGNLTVEKTGRKQLHQVIQ